MIPGQAIDKRPEAHTLNDAGNPELATGKRTRRSRISTLGLDLAGDPEMLKNKRFYYNKLPPR